MHYSVMEYYRPMHTRHLSHITSTQMYESTQAWHKLWDERRTGQMVTCNQLQWTNCHRIELLKEFDLISREK